MAAYLYYIFEAVVSIVCSLHITHRGKYIKTVTLGSRVNTLNQPNLPALALPQRVIHLKEIKVTRVTKVTVALKDRLVRLARMLCRLRSLLLL